MMEDLKNIDSLPEGMVLIRQNYGIKVLNHTGGWREYNEFAKDKDFSINKI